MVEENIWHKTTMAKELETPQVEAETSAEVVTDQPTDQVAAAQQALNVLIQAVEHAQTKGVFSIEDSFHIFNAVKVFRTK